MKWILAELVYMTRVLGLALVALELIPAVAAFEADLRRGEVLRRSRKNGASHPSPDVPEGRVRLTLQRLKRWSLLPGRAVGHLAFAIYNWARPSH